MPPLYKIGQQVIVKPVKAEGRSPRDCTIESYAGQTGKIINYYWIDLHGKTVYIYSVRLHKEDKEIALHEDEIRAY